MADIIQFGKTEPTPELMVWICACGSKHFALLNDDTVECAACKTIATLNGNWHKEFKANPSISTTGVRSTVDYDSHLFAQKSLMRDVGEHTSCLAVFQRDGRIRVWSEDAGNEATPKERAWLLDRFQTAFNLIFNIPDELNPKDDPCQLSMEL